MRLTVKVRFDETIVYSLNGLLHREDEPAIKYVHEDRISLLDGNLIAIYQADKE